MSKISSNRFVLFFIRVSHGSSKWTFFMIQFWMILLGERGPHEFRLVLKIKCRGSQNSRSNYVVKNYRKMNYSKFWVWLNLINSFLIALSIWKWYLYIYIFISNLLHYIFENNRPMKAKCAGNLSMPLIKSTRRLLPTKCFWTIRLRLLGPEPAHIK